MGLCFRLDTLTRNGQSMRQSDGRWFLEVALRISDNVGIQVWTYVAFIRATLQLQI